MEIAPKPRFSRRTSFSCSAVWTSVRRRSHPSPLLELHAIAAIPCSRKWAIQRLVCTGSARSDFVRMTIRGRRASSVSSVGFRPETGIRASTSSAAASTLAISSESSRTALAIWPGYHWMFIEKPFFQKVNTRCRWRSAGRRGTAPCPKPYVRRSGRLPRNGCLSNGCGCRP